MDAITDSRAIFPFEVGGDGALKVPRRIAYPFEGLPAKERRAVHSQSTNQASRVSIVRYAAEIRASGKIPA